MTTDVKRAVVDGTARARVAGILLHPTSLPGPHGVGDLGPAAHEFLDVLVAAGLSLWQLLPLGPTGYGDSPYQSFSSFAGNPILIHVDGASGDFPVDSVDFERVVPHKRALLELAFLRRDANDPACAAFVTANGHWLPDFALFMALKAAHDGAAWVDWPAPLAQRDPTALAEWRQALAHAIERVQHEQFLFHTQFAALRTAARARGIRLMGDLPIYVAHDSADVWANPALFRLDASGRPTVQAGVPPDYFSASGQLWGNPLYDWEHHARTGYGWWIDRLRAAFELYDIIRLDHFRGFDTYWEIPAGAPDARAGRWLKGPGRAFFAAVRAALPSARIIAEDLGYIGPDVVELRCAAGLPGMKVLQFAYGHDANNVNLPHFYPAESVAYTGTHDNITTRGWLEGLAPDYAAKIVDYFQLNGARSAWPIIRAALATPSRLAVIPMQDLLDLQASATLNRPGTNEGNWQWRFTAAELASLAGEKTAQLSHWIKLYDRTGDRPLRDYSEPPQNGHPP